MTNVDEHWWDRIREQMPVTKKWAYFDHAAVAPLPTPAADAVKEWADHFASDGVVDWNQWRQRIEQVRKLMASRIRASEDEIALIRNTTEGISLVAEGIGWQPGDNVVVPDSEFPSNLYPWMNLADRGVEVRQVECPDGCIDPNAIDAACDDRTRVVSVSWVGFTTGWRADLAALADVAHRHGALLFVDAIQGLGVLDLDVSQTSVDFLAADGHKWMLGPEGAGVLYVRREHLEKLRPMLVGWNSVVQSGNFADTRLRLKADASRYEGGTHNMACCLGLAASLAMFEDIPSSSMERRLHDVTALCFERLQSFGSVVSCRDDAHWSGIIALDVGDRDPQAIKRAALREQVVLNVRAGRLRIAPHVYTSPDDIDRLVTAIR